MRWSYQIGRLFGIPIRVHLSLIAMMGLTALLGGGLSGLVLTATLFGSVLVHELGHALVARSKGLPISDISLYPFGGMARMLAAPQRSGDEIAIAAAGPAVSFALGACLWILSAVSGQVVLWWMAEMNLVLGAFNLLPALPMDGGRILRALLARRMGYYRSTVLAARIARYLAMGLALAGVFLSGWLVLIAFLVFFMSAAEQAQAMARLRAGDPGYIDDGPEVLPPERPAVPGAHRVYRDRFGNRIVVEWRER
ncbi:MAG: M50 family metallopeptidase [Deltaproteobacteria bacterium]|nr:M50 family metallopeptidase [Deltaproteobacteria bacterium]